MVRRPLLLFLATLTLVALCLPLPAQADAIDPATIHVGPGGTTGCATGGCYVFGNDVNAIPDGTLDLFQESGGAGKLVDPILLIFAVPNDKTGNVLGSGNITSPAELDNSSGNSVQPPVS